MILSGKELSAVVKEETKIKCDLFLKKYNRKPTLAVILVGSNPASLTYVSGKKKACEELGIEHLDFEYDDSFSQDSLVNLINDLNKNDKVDGILVQLPLPKHIDEITIINSILPEKDVDGFTPSNIGKLLLGQKTLISCTPKGILRILDYYKIQTKGKNVCVVGRSNIVGKPMAALMVQKGRDATVTVCNSHTPNLSDYTKQADILIVAIGQPKFLTKEMVKDDAVVIDVGINRIPDAGKKSGFSLCGDVDYQGVSEVCSAITPVPGGVGPMTIAMLMENTLTAACNKMGTDINLL